MLLLATFYMQPFIWKKENTVNPASLAEWIGGISLILWRAESLKSFSHLHTPYRIDVVEKSYLFLGC